MLSCREIVELVSDWLEGKLPWRQRLAFALHTAMCPPCRAYLRQVKLTVKLLGQLPAPPPEAAEELIRRLKPLLEQRRQGVAGP